MRHQIIILLCIIFALSVSAAAQARLVTNTSLEAYKQERLKNEREYRDNYERLGLPSPEELETRNAKSAKEISELTDKLRADELERERIAARFAMRRSVVYSQPVLIGLPGNVYSYSWRIRHHRFLPRYSQPGYFAGGQFWQTGSATPSRPLMAPSRH